MCKYRVDQHLIVPNLSSFLIKKNYSHRIYDSDKVSHNLNKFNAKMRTLEICLEM